MIVSLFTLLLQAAPASTPSAMAGGGPAQRDAKPVRVWLGSSGSLLRGDRVRVYVETREDGHLVVLHRRTDGHIEVLFPANPVDDPLVRPGTYEIKRAGDRESFVVDEPDGTGLVLAALSPASYRFDEFVRAASWDPEALAPSWATVDGEGALADIVQRMLGDGYFNYDFVTYTVAPRLYTMQDTAPQYPIYPSCVGCTFVGVQVVIAEPLFACDPFFAPCAAVPRRFAHRDRFNDSGIRSVELPMNVIALSVAGRHDDAGRAAEPAARVQPAGWGRAEPSDQASGALHGRDARDPARSGPRGCRCSAQTGRAQRRGAHAGSRGATHVGTDSGERRAGRRCARQCAIDRPAAGVRCSRARTPRRRGDGPVRCPGPDGGVIRGPAAGARERGG